MMEEGYAQDVVDAWKAFEVKIRLNDGAQKEFHDLKDAIEKMALEIKSPVAAFETTEGKLVPHLFIAAPKLTIIFRDKTYTANALLGMDRMMRASITKKKRETAQTLMLSEISRVKYADREALKAAKVLHITMIRVSNRDADDDNDKLCGKAYRDGIADELGRERGLKPGKHGRYDDSLSCYKWHYRTEKRKKGSLTTYRVEVTW